MKNKKQIIVFFDLVGSFRAFKKSKNLPILRRVEYSFWCLKHSCLAWHRWICKRHSQFDRWLRDPVRWTESVRLGLQKKMGVLSIGGQTTGLDAKPFYNKMIEVQLFGHLELIDFYLVIFCWLYRGMAPRTSFAFF